MLNFDLCGQREMMFYKFVFLSISMTDNTDLYQIPARYRKLENLHIALWLIKDLAWVMIWKPLGLFMILPTMTAAVLITWQTRNIKSELLHNIAVVLWISANAYWMIAEFFSKNESLRYYAAIPFTLGIIVISYHYCGVDFKIRQRIKRLGAIN
jgi:prepilin signal peptidase PulO-like enzyme (type II secretory pathway)